MSALKAVILSPQNNITGDISHEILDNQTSAASDRLQIKPLMECLQKQGIETRVMSLNKQYTYEYLNKTSKFDLCFIAKHRSYPNEHQSAFSQFHLTGIAKQKQLGSKIITLYSDNLAVIKGPNGDLYRKVLFLSDLIIAPSKKLLDYAKPFSANCQQFALIPDPLLTKKQNFRPIQKESPIRLIWFGNNANLQYLVQISNEIVQAIDSEKHTTNLTILTSEKGISKVHSYFKNRKILESDFLSIQFKIWDPNNQPSQLERELGSSHIALIPSDPADPRKAGASHNRLIDSINSGCIAIASPINSYLELSKVSLLGYNFCELLRKAIIENERLCSKYSELRDAALNKFSIENNMHNWSTCINEWIPTEQVK